MIGRALRGHSRGARHSVRWCTNISEARLTQRVWGSCTRLRTKRIARETRGGGRRWCRQAVWGEAGFNDLRCFVSKMFLNSHGHSVMMLAAAWWQRRWALCILLLAQIDKVRLFVFRQQLLRNAKKIEQRATSVHHWPQSTWGAYADPCLAAAWRQYPWPLSAASPCPAWRQVKASSSASPCVCWTPCTSHPLAPPANNQNPLTKILHHFSIWLQQQNSFNSTRITLNKINQILGKSTNLQTLRTWQ